MPYLAQIKNPVLERIGEGTRQQIKGNPLVPLSVRLWRTALILGGFALLLYFAWGAVDWLMSEGQPEKIQDAKNKITHAFIGLALLAMSFAIMLLAESIFGFNILNIKWPTPGA